MYFFFLSISKKIKSWVVVGTVAVLGYTVPVIYVFVKMSPVLVYLWDYIKDFWDCVWLHVAGSYSTAVAFICYRVNVPFVRIVQNLHQTSKNTPIFSVTSFPLNFSLRALFQCHRNFNRKKVHFNKFRLSSLSFCERLY